MINKCCKIIFTFSFTIFNSCCHRIVDKDYIDKNKKEIFKPLIKGFYTDYYIKGITSKDIYLDKYYFVYPENYNKLIQEEQKKNYCCDFDAKNFFMYSLVGINPDIYKIRKRCYKKIYNETEIKENLKKIIEDEYIKNIDKFFDNIRLLNFIEKLNEFEDPVIGNFLEPVYNDSNKTLDFKVKNNIPKDYLKTEAATKPSTNPAEKLGTATKSATKPIYTTDVNTAATTNTATDPKKEIKKNIILKKVVNAYLAPDVKDEFKDELDIKDIIEKDDISNKILSGLKSQFNEIKSTDYELYYDELGNSKIENINFDSITNDFTIYVKIKDFYLTEDQKEAVDELKNIKLEDENNNIYSIYELIDKINSNIDKIKNHQYCKNFIKTYNDETNGFIKQYNDIIVNLTSQCENTIKEINGIDETLEEEKIKNLKDKCKQNFKKAAGDYESKDIKTYTNLNSIINDYKSALESLDNKIKLFKEYKNYETGVENEVDKLLTNIGYKNVDDIGDFEKFKAEQQNNFSNITNNLDKKYVNYKSKFELFVNNLKGNFDGVINDKRNEFIKNSLNNEKSKKIFDEIIKSIEDFKKLYFDINNIGDKKLENTEEAIEKEIKSKIDEILTKELGSVDNSDDIKNEIKNKFNDKNIKNNVEAILNIINNKKEALKIKFTLRKKNTENLKDEYSAKFNNIVNIYQVGVRNNVKFSELKSEISEKNDIKLFKDNNEVDYDQNIIKDSVIYVEFPDSYLVKIEIPKHIDEEDNDHEEHTDKENNDPNKKDHTDEGNKNQENIDNSDIKNNTTTKKKCSNSSKEVTNNKKSKKPCCKQK